MNKSQLVTPEKYYLNIDECMMDRWESCYEVGYSSLRKPFVLTKRQQTIEKITFGLIRFKDKRSDRTDFEAWDIIFADFISRIDFDNDFKDYIALMKEYISTAVEYLESEREQDGVKIRNRMILNRLDLIKAKLKQYEKTGNNEKVSIPKMLWKLGKTFGGVIKANETSVRSYFELIKLQNEWHKELNKQT